MKKINLLVRYNFNDTVYVDSSNSDPANPANVGPRAWLNIGPYEGGRGEKGRHKG